MKIVPKFVQNFVSNAKNADFVESTVFAVGVETGLKMIGRPAFILKDKQADSPQKKKYAAWKEFLYQGICLILYFSAIPYVKSKLYQGVSYFLKKNPKNIPLLEQYDKAFQKIEDKKKTLKETLKNTADKVLEATKKESGNAEIHALEKKIKDLKGFRLGKGARDLGSIIGSTLIMAVLAPKLSLFVVHPVLKAIGVCKTPAKSDNQNTAKPL